jgi:hypothetical protein
MLSNLLLGELTNFNLTFFAKKFSLVKMALYFAYGVGKIV